MTATLTPPTISATTPAIDELPLSEPAVTEASLDLDSFGRELDAIRERVLESRGTQDADYIRRVITLQRRLEIGGRVTLMAGVLPPAWIAGVGMLSLSKILENMEIGHNVLHGQWDWMRDPEIHSTTWEWDNVTPASQWKHSHNYIHHQWTNVDGLDNDIGYGVIRIDPKKPWKRYNLAQPLIFVSLATLFEYGIATHDFESEIPRGEKTTFAAIKPKLMESLRKIRKQAGKDFVAYPLLALPLGAPSALAVASGNLAANVIRNWWSFAVIFCGHFPDGVEIFPRGSVENETRGEWYRRQILGSANFRGGPLMHLMTGNLDFQIEHHLFPDLPSNRYAEIAPEVQAICERHGIQYNTGSFAHQLATVVRKVMRLSLPW